MKEARNSLDLLIEQALNKLKEYNIDLNDREAAYQCFDRCCFPKILKEAYEIAIRRRKIDP